MMSKGQFKHSWRGLRRAIYGVPAGTILTPWGLKRYVRVEPDPERARLVAAYLVHEMRDVATPIAESK
jgi:hypothetical protein